ncbi:MAG: flagellar basal body M-ring protein FliF [Ideonella sp. MAG2]|nr:MAG: flagellar basal body M-ring protein FliF [Ideonella sp. MAG2]
MDQLTVPTPLVPAEAPSGVMAKLGALPMASRLKLGIGVAALAAVVVAVSLWANQGDWKVLFVNLSDKDAGAVVAQLSALNVPYRHGEGGQALLVPADRLHEVRMKLATAGLPKSVVAGNELLDNPRLGQTDRQERVMMQRALEGELVRTISKLDGVEEARVHLGLPNQNGFFREQQKPSASVMLTLHPGRSLDRAQVAGIVHLVSSSVPELNPKAVSVLDQRGGLLSGPGEDAAKSLDEQQLRYVGQIEDSYLKRVREIVEPVVGRDNLRATVTADIDFSQSEATSEQYRPNQGDQPAAVRSQQTLESNQPGQVAPAGVPGAATNQPPQPAQAPINGASAPLQPAQMGAAGGGARRENVTNFEVDKTVKVTRNATGAIKRINAAVVVNHRTTTDAKGKTSTVPLPQEELDKLTALVQEAIGFNKERGDSVKVINAPFKVEAPVEPEAVPLWKQPWAQDLMRAAGVPLALALVALGLIFGVIRPAVKQALTPPPPPPEEQAPEGTALEAVVDDVQELPGPDGQSELPALEAPKENAKLEAARKLARENPSAVANIMRDWVNGEA